MRNYIQSGLAAIICISTIACRSEGDDRSNENQAFQPTADADEVADDGIPAPVIVLDYTNSKNVLRRTRFDSGGTKLTQWQYAYNDAGLETEAKQLDAQGNIKSDESTTYEGSYRVTERVRTTYEQGKATKTREVFAYSSTGNLTLSTTYEGDGTVSTEAYSYDSSDRLTKVENVRHGNFPSTSITEYDWDAHRVRRTYSSSYSTITEISTHSEFRQYGAYGIVFTDPLIVSEEVNANTSSRVTTTEKKRCAVDAQILTCSGVTVDQTGKEVGTSTSRSALSTTSLVNAPAFFPAELNGIKFGNTLESISTRVESNGTTVKDSSTYRYNKVGYDVFHEFKSERSANPQRTSMSRETTTYDKTGVNRIKTERSADGAAKDSDTYDY